MEGDVGDEVANRTLLFILSAADENGIQRLASALETHLRQLKGKIESDYLLNLAFTLGNKRSLLPWKSFVLGNSVGDLQRNLLSMMQKPMRPPERPKLQFIFTGQGAQWPKMGTDLLEYRVFRESLQDADKYFGSLGFTWSLIGK